MPQRRGGFCCGWTVGGWTVLGSLEKMVLPWMLREESERNKLGKSFLSLVHHEDFENRKK